jgi:hypothetical protein
MQISYKYIGKIGLVPPNYTFYLYSYKLWKKGSKGMDITINGWNRWNKI